MRVLGVLNGKDFEPEMMVAWLREADVILAADGASDTVSRLGFPAPATIGDFDSLKGEPSGDSFIVGDQDCTDCDKLLGYALKNRDEKIYLIGVEGDRLDHVLSTLSSVVRTPLEVRLVLRRGVGFVIKSRLSIDVKIGTRVSLMPLTNCHGVDFSGVRWPVVKSELRIGGPVSISNRATAERIAVELDSGCALLVVEGAQMDVTNWS